MAGAIITVVGVVFSIMIVTLTLASQQFGPRMLRTFIRDRGTQVTLGTFVATFIYAIRALSPAVNDTFTALTCIDWLSDSLCKIAVEWHPQSYHRDPRGNIRLITVPVSYERLVQRSFEKIRQAADGMPAVLIRQLDALAGTPHRTEVTQPRPNGSTA